MAIREVASKGDIRNTVGDAEWKARVDLAAAYRLIAHYHGSDLTYNHVSLRVPGEPGRLLIKPVDIMFEEVTASALLKYDCDGTPAKEGDPPLRGGGLVIHGGVLGARADLNACIHTHTPAVMGVACQKQGLLPINQYAFSLWDELGYHDFQGFEFDTGLIQPLVRDLGDKKVLLMRNHGALVCGTTISEAFVGHHFLDLACQGQLAAMTGGAELALPESAAAENALEQMRRLRKTNNLPLGHKDWDACLRMAARVAPGYDT